MLFLPQGANILTEDLPATFVCEERREKDKFTFLSDYFHLFLKHCAAERLLLEHQQLIRSGQYMQLYSNIV